ncbi:MAG: hypothetical protein LBB05_03135, partial [Puniceicoccales bacterium]|nr:hypothetical protein [Puniceicoccales bacterium]
MKRNTMNKMDNGVSMSVALGSLLLGGFLCTIPQADALPRSFPPPPEERRMPNPLEERLRTLEEKLRKNPPDGVISELRNLAEKQHRGCLSLLNKCRNSLDEGRKEELKQHVGNYMMLVNFSNEIRELNSGYAEHVPEVEEWEKPLSVDKLR